MNYTYEDIRQRLPGQEVETVILSEGYKRLTVNLSFYGHMDKVHARPIQYRVYHPDRIIGDTWTGFDTFEEALTLYLAR